MGDDYVLGLTEDRCIQVDSDGAYLMSNCSEHTIRLLRAKLTKLEAAVEAQAKVIAAADWIRNEQMANTFRTSSILRYDAAKAELEKVR